MKILDENLNTLDVFCTASQILNNSCQHTLGPNGTNTAVVNKDGRYDIINDGKSIIESITSLDPAISPALETLKQAAFETNRKAGDGTTSTTIMMNSLLHGAKDYLDKTNSNKVELRNKLDLVKETLLEELDIYKKEITEDDYYNIAKVALGSDKYADMIVDIYKFLGKGKRPVLIKTDIPNIEVEKIDGININKIELVSSLFTNTSEYSDVDIICIFEPLNRFNEISQLLRKIIQNGRPTIMFYNKLSTDILENILFNYTNGAIKLIPIGLGMYGSNTYNIMKELADYCDCNIIDNNECKISEISKIKFGNVDYVSLNTDQIIIKNSKKESTNYKYLNSSSVIIHLGGTNIVEREESYKRIEDAINSLGNAIDFGIVHGAGWSYFELYNIIKDKIDDIPDFVEKTMTTIRDSININKDDNIIDSAMVIKEVIENSFSIVSQVITTNAIIHENIR